MLIPSGEVLPFNGRESQLRPKMQEESLDERQRETVSLFSPLMFEKQFLVEVYKLGMS